MSEKYLFLRLGHILLLHDQLGSLNISDMADIMTTLETHSFSTTKWRELGEKLGIRENKLEEIEYEKRRVRDMLREMLVVWLRMNYDYKKYGRPCWFVLVKAMEPISTDVAENIRKAVR